MEKFWMVWRESSLELRVMHDTKEKAQSEAERLSKGFPGHKFYVLESTLCIEGLVQFQRTYL